MARDPDRRARPFDPEQVLVPGRRDPHRLLVLWLVRRMSTALVFLGLAVGTVLTATDDDPAQLDFDTGSVDSVLRGIVSSFGGVFVGILVRLAVHWLALLLAWPLARDHRGDDRPRGIIRRLAVLGDDWTVARAVRELRWTEVVREAALARVGAAAPIYRRIDRVLGVATAACGVLVVVAVFASGLTVDAS